MRLPMNDMPDILAKICAVKRQEIAELTEGTRCAFDRAAAQQAPPRGLPRRAGRDGRPSP